MDDGRDKNAAGAGGLPPESPQGIFTPQPQVSSESGAEQGAQTVVGALGASETSYNPHSATSDSAGAAHPFFANHPTQTYAGSTNDIVIGASRVKPKVNKKPLVIGGVVLAAIIIICVAVLLIGGNKPFSDKVVTETQRKFNQYANYLLYGETKDELTGEYRPYHAYELDNQLSADGINAAYWDTTQDLLGAAVTAYTSGVTNEDTLVFLQTYQQNFSFLRAYRKNGDLSEDLVTAKYISSGINSTESYISDFYKGLANLGSVSAIEFAEQRVTQYRALASILKRYDVEGCLVNGTFADTCISGLVIDSELMELWTTTREQGQAADNLLQTVVRNLENNCWVISAQLHNMETADDN